MGSINTKDRVTILENGCKDRVPWKFNERLFVPKNVDGPIINIDGYCVDAVYLADLYSQKFPESESYYNKNIFTRQDLTPELRAEIFKIAGRTDPSLI